MKKLLLSVVLGLAALTAVGTASAHGHFSAGVYIGGPVWGAPYFPPYYPSYYYPSAPIYVQPAPAYIEREPATSYVEQDKDYWYYCAQSATYYPYVKECPQGWMKVVPGSTPR